MDREHVFLVAAPAMFGLALGVTGCSSAPVEYPEYYGGKCSCRVDGDTVDRINDETTMSMDGSTLFMSCVDVTDNSGTLRLSFSIKAFDGPRQYTLDSSDKWGEVSYNGNDGESYWNVGDDPAAGCTIDVTEASPDPKEGDFLKATFACQMLHSARASIDKFVSITDGSAEGVF